MLSRWRNRARHIAGVLIVAMAALGLPHSLDPQHDPDSPIAVLVEHDASAHAFTRSGPAPLGHQDHCLACHAARSLRLPLTAGPGVSTDTTEGPIQVARRTGLAWTTVDHTAPRGPPSPPAVA